MSQDLNGGAEDDFDIVDVTSKMEPVLQAQEQAQAQEQGQGQVQGQEQEQALHAGGAGAGAGKDRRHRRSHRKKRRKKKRRHRAGQERSRDWVQVDGNQEQEQEQEQVNVPSIYAKGSPENVALYDGQAQAVSVPSDSQKAAMPSMGGERGSDMSRDLLYVPGSGQGAVAGVGSHNSTMSVTTVIHRSKDPAVIVERVKQFLLLYPASVQKSPADFSVVFDIDETLLYTLNETGEVGLQPVGHALYHFCVDQGFETVLVTARLGDPHSLQYLQEQLHVLEYTGYDSISMVNSEHKHDSDPALCKYKSRIDIGKTVLLNVGNRLSDLFLTPAEDDPLLSQINAQSYYCFKGVEPDILCVKLPTD